MEIKFWGVRGSLPWEPILKNLKDKENFQWIGSNTACISIEDNSLDSIIVLDAGTGIKGLGDYIINSEIKNINIFFSHTHWDHIIGLPFFKPLYRSDYTINFISPLKDLRERLEILFDQRFFPVSFNQLSANINVFSIQKQYTIFDWEISTFLNTHPGNSWAYKLIDSNNNSVVYMTDAEINFSNFQDHYFDICNFLEKANVLIFDAQYDFIDSFNVFSSKYNWGHSSPLLGVDIANSCHVEQLYFFHFDPESSNEMLENNLKKILQFCKLQGYEYPINIQNAYEGLVLNI